MKPEKSVNPNLSKSIDDIRPGLLSSLSANEDVMTPQKQLDTGASSAIKEAPKNNRSTMNKSAFGFN